MDVQSQTFRRFSAEDQGMMDSPHNTPGKVRVSKMRYVVARFESAVPSCYCTRFVPI